MFNLRDLIVHQVAKLAEVSSNNTSLLPYPCLLTEYLRACPSYIELRTDKIVTTLKSLRPSVKKPSITGPAVSQSTPLRKS
jgi:hypothetical protein